jgi:hypothetical protein
MFLVRLLSAAAAQVTAPRRLGSTRSPAVQESHCRNSCGNRYGKAGPCARGSENGVGSSLFSMLDMSGLQQPTWTIHRRLPGVK